MKRVYFFGLLALVMIVSPRISHGADPKFRNPLNVMLNPAFSSLYDHDTGSGVRNYYCRDNNVYQGHKGTDFRAAVGTSIYASASGGLYYRFNGCPTYGGWGNSCGSGFGNHARIDHEGNMNDGVGWKSIYAHMQQNTVVGVQSLMCGSFIGKTGSSGWSDGPHLHFEVQKFGYPKDDPFLGFCSRSTSFWVNQNGGVPTTQCQ